MTNNDTTTIKKKDVNDVNDVNGLWPSVEMEKEESLVQIIQSVSHPATLFVRLFPVT